MSSDKFCRHLSNLVTFPATFLNLGSGNINICKGTNAVKSGKQGKYPYPEESIDFFAIHNIPKNDWYIIPRSATGDTMNLRIALKREGKYTRYKDNWNFNYEKT